MSWIFLLLAILLEVSGTICMKLSQGFTRWGPAVLMFVLYGLSFTVLTFVLKKIDVSVAYAIWSGLGTALIGTVGMVWFREPATALKLISIGLIVMGVIGLNLGTTGH